MSRQSVKLLSKLGLTLKVLSKLLYAIADNSPDMQYLKLLHQKVLQESLLKNEMTPDSENDNCLIMDIPWNDIFDAIVANNAVLRNFRNSGRFSIQEIRYMCAMMCGLSGTEYGLITGFRSHYNISWTVRQKIGASKTTNLRLSLRELADKPRYESFCRVAPSDTRLAEPKVSVEQALACDEYPTSALNI